MTLSRGSSSAFRGIRLGSSACPVCHSLLRLSSRVEQLMREDYSIHYHVWTPWDMLELFKLACQLFENFEFELFLKTDFDVEQLIVLRKTPASTAQPANLAVEAVEHR